MGLFTPNDIQNLKSLYILQLRYLLSTENQIADTGLPKMIEAASEPSLKNAFESHLEETHVHAQRLESMLTELDEKASDKKCAVTAALIAAGENIVSESDEGPVRDAGLIGAGQKIEHFEVASYGTARDWARILGLQQHATLLQTTLDEEKHADSVLNSVSQQANRAAAA